MARTSQEQLTSILLLAWRAAGWLCPIGSFRILLDWVDRFVDGSGDMERYEKC